MKKALKRIATAALITVVALSAVFGAGAAGSYFYEDGFTYGVEDGEAYVHSYESDDWDVVIRELFLNKYRITAIEHHAFFEYDAMETLSFYDATYLSSIGSYAFSRCPKLSYTSITPSIQTIGNNAFDSCTSMSYVRFMKGSAADIPEQCFYGCAELSTVIFNNELRSIGKLAFANCASLEKITIPDSVTEIGENAFMGCCDLVIYCTKNSYALKWAKENGVHYYVTDADPEPDHGTESFIRGDADGDSEVTILDATHIQRFLAGIIEDPDGMIALRGDSDGDDELTIIDATMIQRYLVGFETDYVGETVEI